MPMRQPNGERAVNNYRNTQTAARLDLQAMLNLFREQLAGGQVAEAIWARCDRRKGQPRPDRAPGQRQRRPTRGWPQPAAS